MSRSKFDAESIFLAAIERPDIARRAEFVASACGQDAALSRRVEALLAAHDAAGSFLGGPPAGALLRAGDLTDPGDGLPAVRDTLTILSRAHGMMPRVLLRDPLDEPETPVPGPPTASEPRPLPPSARYHFFGEIARGGMGAILKGHDTELNRDLAVKVLLDRHRDNAELVRRFVEEAQIGGQLQHPGIVPIHELGVLPDRRPFFAMRLVKGRTLAELLGARDDPADERPRLLSIFEAICQTVAYAHARGVIHRDLKPSNVMVGSFGEVQVMDWGLAKVLPRGGVADDEPERGPDPEAPVSVIQTARSDSGTDASTAGSILGTPGYMAPEQARGELDRVDERADVFGLGAILCEVLTGEPAFAGRTPGEAIRKAGRGELTEAFARLEGCGADPELIGLAKDCMAAEREDRPRRAGTVAERVAAHLAGVQNRLRAAEAARAVEAARAEEAGRTALAAEARARSERRARRLTAALAAAVLALVFVGGAGGWLMARQRAERLAATTRVVDDALRKAAELRGRALAAPVGEMRDWIEALAEAKRADDAGRQGAVDSGLQERVKALRAELESFRVQAEHRAKDAAAESRLVARLEQIRFEWIDRNKVDPERGIEVAFREFGVDLDARDPKEVGAALSGRAATAEIVAALDAWAASSVRWTDFKDPFLRRLVEVLRATDPDPWRNDLRGLTARPPNERIVGLKRLAADRDTLYRQSAAGLLLLATMLHDVGERELAAEVSHAAWRRSPGDFWVNWMIGMSSWDERRGLLTRPHEALRFLTAAVAIRPHNERVNLNIGNALKALGDRAGAVSMFRDLIRLYPNDSGSYHMALGFDLLKQGKLDEAIAESREAIRLKPDSHGPRFCLGNALRLQGKLDEAVAVYREVDRIRPNFWETHHLLGYSLRMQGKFAVAADEFRKARDRVKNDSALTQEIERELTATERLAALAVRLPAVLCGDDEPMDAAESLEFALLSYYTKRMASSARLFAEAFQADPGLAEEMSAGNRYNAACASALAGAGTGDEKPPTSEIERARWRKQSVKWLEADLLRHTEKVRVEMRQARAEVEQTLEHWKRDPDLAGIREAGSIRSLPADEQKTCRAFWAEVDAVLARSRVGRP